MPTIRYRKIVHGVTVLDVGPYEAFSLSVRVGTQPNQNPIYDTVQFPAGWLAGASPEWLTENAVEAYEIPDPEPPQPTVNDYRFAIRAHVDGKAQKRDYDNAISCATYVSSTEEPWASEAAAFVAWRDAVWVYAFVELDKVMAGQRPQPTIADLLLELPVLVWPG